MVRFVAEESMETNHHSFCSRFPGFYYVSWPQKVAGNYTRMIIHSRLCPESGDASKLRQQQAERMTPCLVFEELLHRELMARSCVLYLGRAQNRCLPELPADGTKVRATWPTQKKQNHPEVLQPPCQNENQVLTHA